MLITIPLFLCNFAISDPFLIGPSEQKSCQTDIHRGCFLFSCHCPETEKFSPNNVSHRQTTRKVAIQWEQELQYCYTQWGKMKNASEIK